MTLDFGETLATPRFKQVLAFAFKAAKTNGNNFVGVEHLMMGILLEGNSVACAVLKRMLENTGVTLDALQQALRDEMKICEHKQTSGENERDNRIKDAACYLHAAIVAVRDSNGESNAGGGICREAVKMISEIGSGPN